MTSLESVKNNFENRFYQADSKRGENPQGYKKLFRAKKTFFKNYVKVQKNLHKWKKKKYEIWTKKNSFPKESFAFSDKDKIDSLKKHKRIKLALKITIIVLAVLAFGGLVLSGIGLFASVPLLMTIGNCVAPIQVGLALGIPGFYKRSETRRKVRATSSSNFQEFVQKYIGKIDKAGLLDEDLHSYYKDYKKAVKALPKK